MKREAVIAGPASTIGNRIFCIICLYGSRAVGCPLGREIIAKMCSLLGNEGTPPDFECFCLEKRPRKRGRKKNKIGENESTPRPIIENTVVGAVILLPKFLSRKISPEKSLDFLSQKSVLLPALRTRSK